MDTPDSIHYRNVASLILQGKVIPFLGAGVNLCAREPVPEPFEPGPYLPSGSELAGYLAAKWEYPPRDAKDLLNVSQYIGAMLGPGVLYEDLREVFTTAYVPNAVHRLLARLSPLLHDRDKPQQLVVTTNYDDALERAYDDVGVVYDVVHYDARPHADVVGRFRHRRSDERLPDGTRTEPRPVGPPNEFDELDLDERPVVLKIHGAVDRDHKEYDSFVITEDDYVEYLVRDEIRTFQALKTPMKQRHFLFLGYSLHDWNLRVILNRIWEERDLGKNSWAIQKPDRKRSGRSIDVERKLWRERGGVELLFDDLAKYVANLAACLPPAAAATAGAGA